MPLLFVSELVGHPPGHLQDSIAPGGLGVRDVFDSGPPLRTMPSTTPPLNCLAVVLAGMGLTTSSYFLFTCY